jgi:hypothetical protein
MKKVISILIVLCALVLTLAPHAHAQGITYPAGIAGDVPAVGEAFGGVLVLDLFESPYSTAFQPGDLRVTVWLSTSAGNGSAVVQFGEYLNRACEPLFDGGPTSSIAVVPWNPDCLCYLLQGPQTGEITALSVHGEFIELHHGAVTETADGLSSNGAL